jgi:hypothetical protein
VELGHRRLAVDELPRWVGVVEDPRVGNHIAGCRGLVTKRGASFPGLQFEEEFQTWTIHSFLFNSGFENVGGIFIGMIRWQPSWSPDASPSVC